MTPERTRGSPSTHAGPSFWAVIALGGLLGYVLAGNILDAPIQHLMAAFSLGLAWAYIFLQWADLLSQGLSVMQDPIPLALDVADRKTVRSHLETLADRQALPVRFRHLLERWSAGWESKQVIDLAVLQSEQTRSSMRTGMVVVLLLAFITLAMNGNPWLAIGAVMALAVTALARQSLVSWIDAYIEGHLLARLPSNVPQTATTAAELADALGGAIKQAFRDHVPQPEQSAQAMKSAVEAVVANVSSEVGKLEKTFVENQSSIVEKWTHAATTTTADLKDTEKALASVVGEIVGGLGTNAEKLKAMLASHTHDLGKSIQEASEALKAAQGGGIQGLQEALAKHAEKVNHVGVGWGDQMKAVLAEHSANIQSATKSLADQLGKIAALEKDIEKVLHVQQAVDSTLKAVATTEEFKLLFTELRTHLQESDKLLREVAKPRTIRLVEADGEVVATPEAEKPAPKPAAPAPAQKPAGKKA